ncbi:retrovirus-related Pol polyprotein from transposon 412 [Trichonephila clavipes]|nr:retrovirus-related Pol polyprotein from transposon 412 [Trichonephila clavipes]
MIRWALKLSEFNIEWEHRPGVQNVVADLLSRNPVDSIEGSQISCAALRALAINSREQFIREQREDPELGHIYRYLENSDDGSVNATVCEVSKYPNEIVTLDLLGPCPASRPKRYKFILVISDHFTKWCELIPLRKASAQAIANALFDNYIARYGAPISLITDNGPQFISDVFEHLSHRLDIKHMKTVTYRPQANLTERVNRNLVQMIASFVEENHENWDQFLHEFAFALRTEVNETTNKTLAELFLGRKIIIPFSKLINVTDDTKYVGRNIKDYIFDEARRNMRKKHKSWGKYYNRRRDVHIKVNDLVLIQTHFLSAAGRKQVGKFMPKFEGPYRVLEVKGPSRLPDCRLNKSTTVESRTEGSGRDNKTRQTTVTTRGCNKQAERPVRSNQATTRRPCPYYLRSRVKESDGIPEEQRNIEINGIPHIRIRRRSLSDHGTEGAKCQNIGVVELNIRIIEFQKPWLLHVLADLEYPCILGIDFIGGSKIILDFDRKSFAIPDSQIDKVVKTVEEEKVEIHFSKPKFEEKQKRELQDLFNSFQELFSDKPGLTHVLYHEIDTGDNPPVVSRPYRYDRVKQEILDYHVDKMLKEGTIIPIQSPYASLVVLCRKNNGLHRRIIRKYIDLQLISRNLMRLQSILGILYL